ncbi:hypothetical protein HZS_7482 [Henneguya salminicola]|nr:hypothetical protein HZS_7482 [Henneguya salminicola]
MMRSRYRVPSGSPPNPFVFPSRKPNITMILAINAINIILGDGNYTVPMDNAPINHGCREFYDDDPPYHEDVFSNLKTSALRNGTLNVNWDLAERMISAWGKIKQTHLKNYFIHLESFFELYLSQFDKGKRLTRIILIFHVLKKNIRNKIVQNFFFQ